MNFVAQALLVLQIVGGEFAYSVRPGDSLTNIGAYYGVEARVIAGTNGLKPSARLVPDQVLAIDNRHIAPAPRGADILINIPQRMLFVYAGDSVRGYPIAAGKSSWRTPIGAFTAVAMEVDPVWDVPLSIQEEMRAAGKPVLTRVPPSPENPLGKYWIGLSLPGIGIHGTNSPSSIFSLQTHGCIRVHPDNMADLFGRLWTGATGETIYEPVLLTNKGGEIYLEVHPDGYRKGPKPMETVQQLATKLGVEHVLDWTAVEQVIRKRDGIARRVDVPSEPREQ